MIQRKEPNAADLQIAPSGEPIIIVPEVPPSNDIIEIHIAGDDADIIVDGDVFGRFTIMTNTLKSWLVMAEEVGIQAANTDGPFAALIYAPVFQCRKLVQPANLAE
ncbi:MAG: hypothetical protein KI792_06650 [Alphaproteobacteria bacterium]|nr:hypothetical protein [Alphaproteobacteria bacterium SS10]